MPLKAIKGLLKIVPGMLKLIPLLLKGTLFLFQTLPTFIIKVISNTTNFIKKAIPLSFAVVISFIIVFFGIQMFLGYLTGNPNLIPHLPLALFTLYIIVELVLTKTDIMKTFQSYILKLFLLIFNNPLTRDLLGFNVKVDPKNPSKSIMKILQWSVKNVVKIILTIFFIAFIFKVSYEKIWGYITFYTE
jgi:hypothetical protein